MALVYNGQEIAFLEATQVNCFTDRRQFLAIFLAVFETFFGS